MDCFVVPLQQTPLSGLCILGCIVGMCLGRCSFKAKHKADSLFSMRHSPCLTATHTHTRARARTQTLTYKNHTHRAGDAGTYLRETSVAFALTSTVLLFPVLSYASCWPVERNGLFVSQQADCSFRYKTLQNFLIILGKIHLFALFL